MMAPAKTPDAIIAKLNRDVGEIMRTPAMQDMLRTQGAEAAPGTPDEFAAFIASETVRLKKVVDTAGLGLN